MKQYFIFIILLFTIGFLSACSDGGNSQTPKEWYYERELAGLPGLVITPDKTVLLQLARDEAATTPLAHAITYRIDAAASYTYCLDEDDSYLTSMKLTDASGRELLALNRGECGVVDLLAGNHLLSVYHDALAVPEGGGIAFISLQGNGQVSATSLLTGYESMPLYPEFRSIRVAEPGLQNYRLFFTPAGSYDLLKALGSSDTAATELLKQGYHLFSLKETSRDMATIHGSLYTLANHDTWGGAYTSFACAAHPEYCLSTQSGYPNSVTLLNRTAGPGSFDISVVNMETGYGFGDTVNWLFASPVTGYFYLHRYDSNRTNPTLLYTDTGLRAFRSATDMPQPPGEAEVGIYEGTDYSGKVFVVAQDQPDTTVMYLPTIRSIKPGFNATLVLYSEKQYQGTSRVIAMPSKNVSIAFSNAQSLKVLNSRKILISSHKCVGCNLAMVDLSKQYLKGVDLTRALLYGANLSYANLEEANLCQAFLNGNAAMSHNQAAVLRGAYLKNVNLSTANIGGADFSYAAFYSSTAGSCPQDCSMSQKCASAYNATMTATKFDHAYLSGTDFSSATALGTSFQGAVLAGANLTAARLGTDANTGQITSFAGAFLQGATFKDVDTGGVNYSSAYVDIDSAQGNSLYILLSGDYTRFARFWKQSGSELCVRSNYPSQTVLPPTSSYSVCPDGQNGACSQTQWRSPVINMGNALPKTSYGSDSKKVCTTPDSTW